MVTCDYCNRNVAGYPHKCKYCGQLHCPDHLLPESHECEGLKQRQQRNVEKWKQGIASSVGGNYVDSSENGEEHTSTIKHPKTHKKLKFSERFKNYGLEKYEGLKYWLRKREHHKYDYEGRASYLITTVLLFAASIVGIILFYSNASKLNEIGLWIIKLAGVLILVSLFFAVKFGWRLGKEGINIFKRQRNWLKYLVVILIAFLLWQAYTHKDTALNPIFEAYNKTNFTVFVPFSFGNLSLDSGSSPPHTYSNDNKGTSGFGNFVNSVFDPKSQIDISELEQEVNRRINLERTNNGLKPLNWDNTIATVARDHSEDMVNRNFFAHDNPDGEDPTARGKRHGYSCYKDYGSYYTVGLAENIAETPIYSDVIGCGSTTSLDSLAECIVDGWMTSPGHRENILTSTYTKTGIGIAYSSDDKAYSTQDFC
jgi:uncharacterized protein YkwD